MGDYVGRSIREQALDCRGARPRLPASAARRRRRRLHLRRLREDLVRRARDPRRRRDLGADAVGPARRALGSAEARRRRSRGAMRLTPPEPSFLDARNAILQLAADAAAARRRCGTVFAARGMGFYASTTGAEDVVAATRTSRRRRCRTTGRSTGFVAGRRDRRAARGRDGQRRRVARPRPHDRRRRPLHARACRGARYASVIFSAPGYDRVIKPVTVGATPVDLGAELRRNWASASGGATSRRRRRPQGPGLRVAGGDRPAPRHDVVGARGRRAGDDGRDAAGGGQRARASASIRARAAWTTGEAAARTVRIETSPPAPAGRGPRAATPTLRRRRPAPHERRRRPQADGRHATCA